MFGGSGLFSTEGGDVNAGAMSGGDTGASVGASYGSSDPNIGGGYGAQSGADFGTQASDDPAMKAFAQSEYNANATTQDTKAQQTAGQVNMENWGGNALMSGLFMAFDSKAKKVARKQRVLARAQSQAAIDNSIRAKDQFADDSARQRQGLEQSYSGRGVGESSIHDEGMKYFNDQAARKAAELDQNIILAQMGKELTYSQISASYAQPYMHIIGGVLNMI